MQLFVHIFQTIFQVLIFLHNHSMFWYKIVIEKFIKLIFTVW